MLKRTVLVVVCAAAILAFTASALAAGVRSTVTIDEFSSGGSPDYFIGQVKSPRRKCEVGRRVTLYRTGEMGQFEIGSDRTARSKGDKAIWVIEQDMPEAGTFVAKVKRQRKGPTTCRRDRSPDFPLN